MLGEAQSFAAYLRSRLGTPVPVELETRCGRFLPLWHGFVTFVSSHLERELGPEAADVHNELLYRVPSPALVPRGGGGYTVFVRRPRYDSVYLGVAAAHAFATTGLHRHSVPLVRDEAVPRLVAGGMNPAVLSELLYLLPLLAALPAARAAEAPLARDLLVLRAQSYLASSDAALALLGYLVLRLLREGRGGYEGALETARALVRSALRSRGLRASERELRLSFLGTPTAVYVVEVAPDTGPARP